MVSYERKNRIDEALSLRGMKKIELSDKTGIHKATISNWINQKYQPKQKSLILMAKVLDVSEIWLAGYDVDMERPVEQKKMDQLADTILKIKSDKRYSDLVDNLLKLDDTQLDLVENLINQLLKTD